MGYLLMDAKNDFQMVNHGSTTVESQFEINLSYLNSNQYFDVFILSTKDDIACYDYVVKTSDWLYECDFLSNANKTYLKLN